ncbi:hypothetical protein NPX13_g9871 [Xylaria arbuscula]|uniref:Uncharacterized protein n=1 Tax=Xylaria arbuscula TaxID=114810 RepID=A0A9W8TIM0_9PEZI|nr:hypothetical protein NPX13_g9871 [Xylaria arbuscula]
MNGASPRNHPPHDDATYNTALRGAFLAFQKTATTPTTNNPPTPISTTTPSRDTVNGALIAATSASRDRSIAPSPSVSRQTTGNAATPSRINTAIGQNHLLTPAKSISGDARSPSLIAATLAASRSVSPSPKPLPPAQLNYHNLAGPQWKGNMGNRSPASSVANLDLTTDSSSIGPTNALVSLFEQKEGESDPVKKSPAVTSSNKRGLKIGLRPMTPPRTMSPVLTYETSPSRLASSFAWDKASLPSPSTVRSPIGLKPPLRDVGILPEAKRQRPPTPPARKTVDSEVSVSTTLPNPRRKPRPVTPPPRVIRQANTSIVSPQPRRTASQKITSDVLGTSPTSSAEVVDKSVTKRRTRAHTTTAPRASYVDEKGPSLLVRRSSSSLSNDTFVSASSTPSLQPDSPRKTPEPSLPLRSPSVIHPSILPPVRLPALQSSSNLPLDSLTNAIVAGSLASARATPSKPPTPPPPRKQTPHMRHTLRAPRTKSEEEITGVASHHKKKPLGKLSSKKKHAHHEAI